MTIEAVVFDAYGTLFDVMSVETTVKNVVHNAVEFTALWRAKQLEYAFLRTLMNHYADFWQVTGDALDYTAARFELDLQAEQRETLLDAWLNVQAFPDAADALANLTRYRRAILSNGTPAMIHAAVTANGLEQLLDTVLSVEQVRMFKPRPEVYALVEQELGVAPQATAFVSSNGWDVAGAAAFGFQVYWINRNAWPYERLGVQPTATVHSLRELVAALQPM